MLFFRQTCHIKVLLLFVVFRKREEEQRRREAVQRVSVATAEKRKVSVARAEQEKLSLVNIIEDLSMNDSMVETKKSSKPERMKSKEDRHKGTKQMEIPGRCNDPLSDGIVNDNVLTVMTLFRFIFELRNLSSLS